LSPKPNPGRNPLGRCRYDSFYGRHKKNSRLPMIFGHSTGFTQ
jgi:hypothetical protein